ncbi:TPA: galactitol-1-phosphate 5-dehydrogenase [Staphylococcus argenteus]|uniref:galactitol-1-phosphate 5-dehydrogenase n=1 Tax=Staphylococcus argenteus TaxID=985002 RepID=UPI000501FB05|nr:galactitol-1-phosphate 5-dehydrogenase [Staphylococcus argenteus]MDT3004642.1 galactitol-1-phosphate 5-dehydrogenase [Staphylococcus argenteus]UPO21052.1 galactitol-1-phosphate 5-dehydrogenase [Staphylococcus argenteus]CDR64606.1 putative zinc-binding dehydrogenase [Staphylococcus argenteus]HDY9446006.1 galactitol-1-phosphate 5-dehydrogenase [Staphylococcus argenteus]HDY9498718.1 galactitol-1-phosphate 5-dehydrogenase [Staphylococcus argenteus]
MKALKLYGVEDLRYEDCAKPDIEKSNDVVVKVRATGICGSDTSRYKKMGPYIKGMPFGHEFSGVVEAIGNNVTHVKVGDKVTGCPAIPCYECDYCLKGEFSRCEQLYVIGSYEPGSFAEYVKLPAQNIIKVPENVDFIEAAMIEPSAVVAHGFYKTNIKPGITVAVMGCGSIGLLAIQWARIFGATHIIAIDIDTHKLDIAKSLGAHQTINSRDVDLEAFIENNYANQIDLAIESSGAKVTIGQILTLPKKGGEVVLLGIPYDDIDIDRVHFEKILRNELTVYGSWNALSSHFPGREWTATLSYMAMKDINVKPIISHYLPLEKGPDTFDKLVNKKETFDKVMFTIY